jgi:hypothetical protein
LNVAPGDTATIKIIMKVCDLESTVAGVVVDAESGEPVPWAAVVVVGGPESVYTDLQGQFRVRYCGGRCLLKVMHIDFKTQEKLLDVAELADLMMIRLVRRT